ncbi:putative mitochondrial glycoprotein [Arabidopsis thaliana]|jgi:hypothetical protein|nr:Mitochondrial glycoprotein family protein [Arabidopsis thaliana]KAG7618170.1 Mitochondrial glycoprotein [Arabidopsis thaliana x Arabidopsis arenosa]KAG7622632.1 Mitochondrial glycoprotein [Arabidopsis suecica]AAM91613.1 putative protein [Arabidopsis thaliana]AAN15390.1 putative protein [Arabidopsis thaliana]AEE86088.1 Mitochondrial glycoprotein family protein [Arabidopsis thaliana]|eukprot:NP_001078481.1 Mitochondrial glycoprotein family protein [Arabidopsis thaliana]
MWRRVIGNVAVRHQLQRALSSKAGGSGKSANVSAAVDSMLLRSLKEHYLEVSKMTPPPKVSPPSPFEIVKGSLEGSTGAVLKKSVGNEEINLFVMRLAHGGDEEDDGGINQLFLHVAVSKPNQPDSLHFLCGLYPDALGIHSVSMRPKLEALEMSDDPTQYTGPSFEELDEKMRDVFHGFLEERGVNESLFPFLQAWLYVKDHRNLLRWFKSVGTFVHENPSAENTA